MASNTDPPPDNGPAPDDSDSSDVSDTPDDLADHHQQEHQQVEDHQHNHQQNNPQEHNPHVEPDDTHQHNPHPQQYDQQPLPYAHNPQEHYDQPRDASALEGYSLRDAQLHARQTVQPLRLAHFFVNHTSKTCTLALLFPIICLVIVAASGTFELSSTNRREFYVFSDEVTKNDDSRNAARDNNPFLEPGQNISSLALLKRSSRMNINILMRGLRKGGGIANLDNFNPDTTANVLQPAVFAEHKKIEDEFLSLPDFESFCRRDPTQLDCDGVPRECALPFSYLNHPNLYGQLLENSTAICGRREGNEEVSQENFTAFLDSVYGSDPYRMRVFFDANSTSSDFAWAAKSTVLIGAPLPGYNSSNDRTEDQDDEFVDWARDTVDDVNDDDRTIQPSRVDVYALSSAVATSEFNDIIAKDLTLAGIAIILVLLVMWVHTTSFVLSISTIFQILLSFPFAYFFFYFVFQQRYFGALQVLTVFLLLGIGADDVFVFTDAWKQAAVKLGEDVDLETRMAWTYRRSVRAMTVTSFTTAAAFFVTAASPLMPISTLGVWAAILVLLQFFLVITFYPCAVVTWHRYWRPRLFVQRFRMVEDPEELEVELATKWWQRFIPLSRRPEPHIRKPGEYRSVERFFRGPWFNFLSKARWIIIALSIAFAGVSLWQGLSLETPRETESLLPESHPIWVASDTLRDAFPRSDVDLQLRVWVVWGVTGRSRAGLSKFDVTDLGQPIYDMEFDLTKSAVQQRILDACSFFASRTDLIFNGSAAIDPINCWIRDYYEWRNETFVDFASQDELIDDLLEFANASESNQAYFNLQRIALNANRSRVVFTEIGFVGSTDANAPEREMWPIYEEWRDLMDDFNSRSPAGADKAFVTGGHPWIWAVTQQTLVSSMIQSLIIMICVALATLMVATTNWYVAIIATICITGVIFNLLGLISIVGWNLGTTESVSVIIGVGYSFDGTAHMATAYVESEETSRSGRVRDALTELAISVLFGSLTTFLAGAAMTPATIVFFQKFAVLLTATVTLSLFWSVMVFPAFMLCFGPEKKVGSIPAILDKINCFRRRGQQGEADDNDMERGNETGPTAAYT